MRNKTSVIIGTTDFSNSVPFPFTKLKALDESLDCITFELVNTSIALPFKPFTDVTFNGDKYIVSQDNVEEIVGTGLFKHEITAIEDTKKAERIICGAKAFTKPLNIKYTNNKTTTIAYIDGGTSTGFTNLSVIGNTATYGQPASVFKDCGGYRTPIIYNSATDKVTLYSYTTFDFSDYTAGASSYELSANNISLYYSAKENPLKFDKYTVKRNYGSVIILNTSTVSDENIDVTLGMYALSKKGHYVARQNVSLVRYFDNGSSEQLDFDLYTSFSVVIEPYEKSNYTLREVVDILLETCEPLRKDIDVKRFTHSVTNEMKPLFDQPAPEFHFANGRSLWDNLLEVGKYIHCIPRITNRYLTFERLGENTMADFSKCRVTGWREGYDISDYTAGLASVANNLINMDDSEEGSVTDPFSNGYISLRANEEEYRINDGTGIIKTKYPIARLIKLEAYLIYNGKEITCDITPYVFESSEYSSLSSYRGDYPFSKTYALYYTQDSPNIEGLWFKAQDSAVSAINAIESYSILNVLSAASGISINNSIFTTNDIVYPELCFRIKYMPLVNAFVKAYKTQYDSDFPSVLSHNQSANKLSSRAFGENLRGQLAMLSTTSKTVMAIAKEEGDIPPCGTLYDEENYISQTMTRVFPDYVVSQIILSTEFNQLGSYVETNNAIRQYEIPSEEDRYISVNEFCDITENKTGDNTRNDDANLIISETARTELIKDFSTIQSNNYIDIATTNTYDASGSIINTSVLPVISLSIGNSIYFGFDFDDNVSSGSKSSEGGSEYRVQDYVKYGDEYYAHLKYLGFKLSSSKAFTNISKIKSTALSLPESNSYINKTDLLSTGDNHFIVDKDSADALKISYQLHYISSDGFIIGKLSRYSKFIKSRGSSVQMSVCYFDHRINKINGATSDDKTNHLITSRNISTDSLQRIVTLGNAPEGAVSWAIMCGNDFIIGGNGKIPKSLKLSFKRKI